jgi:murein DD-endopeptidase MepM/ murein hydrolase activator NlpD
MRGTLLALGVAVGFATLSAVSPAGAEPNPGLTLPEVRQQLDELEQRQADLSAQKLAAQEKLKTAQAQLDSTRVQIVAEKEQMTQLQAQIGQIALQQYQDRGMNTTAIIMASSDADAMLGKFSVVRQVSDTANILYTALQLKQAGLADLERSEAASVTTITAEQAKLDTLEQQTQSEIAEATRLLDEMTQVAQAKAAAKSASLAGDNAVGVGVKDPSKVVPEPSSALVPPLSKIRESSPFGMRVHPITGGYTFHDGLDLSASCGTTVTAPANGLVIDYYWAGGYGNRLVLDNGLIGGHHIVTSYNHLSGALVSPGDSVTQGQPIAQVGTTGASTGCHLHWMIWNDGELIDPDPFV